MIKIIFNVEDFNNIINKYNIKANHIEMLLYSMRFCLRSITSSEKDSLYNKILSGDNTFLSESYFIGNDISENNYYDIYLKLIDHFNTKPKQEGVYVCLCKTGFYQYIPNGLPNEKNANERCKYCSGPIGYNSGWFNFTSYPIKRDGYVRIYKDEEDITNESKEKLQQINYITLSKFYEDKIKPIILQEKPGIIEVSEEHFKKNNKIIRKLDNKDSNQITYRLLNFILYSHLFFGKIMNNHLRLKLPENMDIINVLEEDWEQLKNALGENIDLVIFINSIFKSLTDKLISIKEIETIENLIDIEQNLDSIIRNGIEKYKEYAIIYNEINNKLTNIELDSSTILLTEHFDFSLYKEESYPFYKYFLYTDYILEKNIKKQNDEDYKMLNKYIDRIKYDKEIKHLETLYLFNCFNNLLFDTYSNKITTEEADQKKLNEEKVYSDNISLFNIFFNNLKKIDENLTIKKNDHLNKFLISKNSDEGEQSHEIYQKYIREQNNLIEDILINKHNYQGFPIPEKINVQSALQEEIFSFKIKKTCLTEIIFENSFRDCNFKKIIINYDNIENQLTDKLLRKVKMFNDNIKFVIYSNQKYLYENTSIFTDFMNNYRPLKELNKQEKLQIKKFFEKIKTTEQCIKIIDDFNEIVLNLNKRFKNKNINEKIQEKEDSDKYENNKNEAEKDNQIEIKEKDDKEEKNDNEKDEGNKENKEDSEKGEKEESKKDNENIENEEIKDDRENEKNKDNEEINKDKNTKIIEIIKAKNYSKIGSDNYSNEFNDLLGNNEGFTLDKLVSIFYFSEKLMFLIIRKKIEKYCQYYYDKEKKDNNEEEEEQLKKKVIELKEQIQKKIEEFYKDRKLLSKEILSNAIRRYITRYLIREEDKEKNIKNNNRNLIKYLYIEDLWANEIDIEKEKREEELLLLKHMNIPINQIIYLYDILDGDNITIEELNELKDIEESLQPIDYIKEDDNKKEIFDNNKNSGNRNENTDEKINEDEDDDDSKDNKDDDEDDIFNNNDNDYNEYMNNNDDDDDR